MMMITVTLIKPLKDRLITYQARPLLQTETLVVVEAIWTVGGFDLGVLQFATGDRLIEYFYSDRWYNIFELRSAEGRLKGWYCNVTRPAVFYADRVESEDLELDLLVSADRSVIRLDDEDEFARRRLDRDEPPAYAAALSAVEELKIRAARGDAPFDAPFDLREGAQR